MFGQYFGLIRRLKSGKYITQVSRFHKRISRFGFNKILRHVKIVVLGFFFFGVIELDTVFGLLREFLNALDVSGELIDGEFGVLLWEDHGLDEVEEHFGNVFFGHEFS
jgi:hypothetical protein